MTATVVKGGRTSVNVQAQGNAPKGASAARIIAEIEKDTAERGVLYAGNCDHLFLYPPKPLFANNGERIGSDPGLFVDFGGAGITKPRFPEKNKADKDYCARLDKAIKEQHPDCVQFDIRRLEKKCPLPPASRWYSLSLEHLKVLVEANLQEDHESNQQYVKLCALYETFRKDEDGNKAPRKDVLKMLDGVLSTEAALDNAFDAEIDL